MARIGWFLLSSKVTPNFMYEPKMQFKVVIQGIEWLHKMWNWTGQLKGGNRKANG